MTEDQQSMLDYLNTLNNNVVEVRIHCKDFYAITGKRTGYTCYGYYNKENFVKLVKDIEPFTVSDKVESICVTIQDIDNALLARADNRIKYQAKTGELTGLSNIVNYTIFPIDIDPDRPSKISSSNEEMQIAQDCAKGLVNGVLKDIETIKAMSGNGYHLLIPLNPFPATEENKARWKRVGDVVALDIIDKYDDIEGDNMVYSNPTFKLYGTWARKGDSTDDRFHRKSKVKIPDEVKRYDFDDIEKLILEHEDNKRYVPKSVFNKTAPSAKYNDLKEFLDKNSIEYDTPKQTNDGLIYPMTCCFDESHGKDAFAIQRADGRWGWKCFHSSCQGLSWHDFREQVAPKQNVYRSQSTTRGYIDDDNQIHDIEDIDDTPDERIEFPIELMDGIPSILMLACRDRKDLQPEFIHAVTFNNLGAIFGRRLFLVDDPPVFPNLYTIIVGQTGFAQKSQVTKLGKIVMKMADQNVIRQTSLATSEGLINLFVFPNKLFPGCEIPADYDAFFADLADKEKQGVGRYCETFDDDYRSLRSMVEESSAEEGFRLQLVQNELGSLLKKSRKGSGSGLTETLTELYDMEDVVTSPTKTSPTAAHYPCMSIIGSTTMTWLEKHIDIDDIHAGFINRFAFYFNNDININDKRMFTPPIDKELVISCAKAMNEIRNYLPKSGYGMEVDDEGKEFSEEWHANTIKQISAIENEIVRDSLSRFALHCKKFALLYGISDNAFGDKTIKKNSMEKACKLTSYHISVARKLFGDFASNEMQKIEDVVYLKVRSSGTRGCTAREISNSTRRASIEQISKAIESLEKSHFIGKKEIPYNKGRFKWHAIKEVDLDNI